MKRHIIFFVFFCIASAIMQAIAIEPIGVRERVLLAVSNSFLVAAAIVWRDAVNNKEEKP